MEESSMKAARAHVKSHVEATKQGQFSCMMHHEYIAHKISMPSMQNKTGSTLVNNTSDFFKKRAQNCEGPGEGKISA